MSLAVLEREQGGADGVGGILCWKEEEGEEEELRFRDQRHLYSSLICDGVRKEVRVGLGARQEHRQDCGRGTAIKERVLEDLTVVTTSLCGQTEMLE